MLVITKALKDTLKSLLYNLIRISDAATAKTWAPRSHETATFPTSKLTTSIERHFLVSVVFFRQQNVFWTTFETMHLLHT
jgi:hypothetical protein